MNPDAMTEDIYGIGIETSCDETGIAIIKNGKDVIANPLFTQMDMHRLYGGVVPEMASRMHLEKFPLLLEEILNQHSEEFHKASYVAVTVRPGLVGSLLVGYYLALGIKTVLGIPLIPVHHLEAHFYASILDRQEFTYPFLGLLLSGGNSSLYKVSGIGRLEILGDTMDDACGEAFDKAAAMLGLDYPGGPEIEKRAAQFVDECNRTGNATIQKNPLPVILKNQNRKECNFSFSGLKTALYYHLKNGNDHNVNHLCWCFQERAFEIIERNIKNAMANTRIKTLVAAGGVISNSSLRNKITIITEKNGGIFVCPPPKYCTDNGAMIAALGYEYFKNNIRVSMENAISSKTDFLGILE